MSFNMSPLWANYIIHYYIKDTVMIQKQYTHVNIVSLIFESKPVEPAHHVIMIIGIHPW